MHHSSIIIEKNTDGYLAGKLLVATPLIQESYFTRSVIYILSHDESGAMGIIINHVIKDLHCSSIFNYLNIHYSPHYDPPVYFGGPVESARGFILHTGEAIESPILFSANIDVLKEIAIGEGPRKNLFALGYSGWEAGQLEQELQENSWLIAQATEALVFNSPNSTKWLDAIHSLGIDIGRFSNEAGHA